MESTYGNRMHAPAGDMEQQLLDVIERTREKYAEAMHLLTGKKLDGR